LDLNGLLDLKKALGERVLNAEVDHLLVREEPSNQGKTTVITDTTTIARTCCGG
jgi:hypothetical protein